MTNVNCIFLTSSGRLWRLKFYAAPGSETSALGPWAISLSLINPSPPTWLSSLIYIEPQRKSAHIPPRPLPKGTTITSVSSPNPRPLIEFRLLTKSRKLQPPTSTKMKLERNELVVQFAENATSSELQYPYAFFFPPECIVHL